MENNSNHKPKSGLDLEYSEPFGTIDINDFLSDLEPVAKLTSNSNSNKSTSEPTPPTKKKYVPNRTAKPAKSKISTMPKKNKKFDIFNLGLEKMLADLELSESSANFVSGMALIFYSILQEHFDNGKK